MRRDIIENWLTRKGYSLWDKQYQELARFQELVLAAPMNLTAIKDAEGFAVKHFIDSLTLLPWVDKFAGGADAFASEGKGVGIDAGAGIHCIDIGTGAGFPGVPLKIARPGMRITLLDSLLKRILFLRGAVEELGLSGVECVHGRAEDFARVAGETAKRQGRGKLSGAGGAGRLHAGGADDAARLHVGSVDDVAGAGLHVGGVDDVAGARLQRGDGFDIAIARAVARLEKLAGYALPLVRPGGVFLAMKGPDVSAEIKDADAVLSMHGAVVEGVETIEISQGMVHSVVVVRKGRAED